MHLHETSILHMWHAPLLGQFRPMPMSIFALESPDLDEVTFFDNCFEELCNEADKILSDWTVTS